MSIVHKLIDAKDPDALKLWADGVYQQLMALLGGGTTGGGVSMATRIQHGTATITGVNTSTTVTVAAVDPDSSVLMFSWTTTSDFLVTIPRGTITDATTLTFTRAGPGGSSTTTIEWTLTEY